MWQCSQQHENRDEAKFCAKCGEKRETRARCSACGSVLEPEDVFCTSCGHPRAPEPKPAVPIESPKSAGPIEAPKPVAPPAEPKIDEPKTEEPKIEEAKKEDEPVTFSFGGATIEMKDDPSKPDKLAKPPAQSGGMSSTTSGILSFLLIAAVLYGAFYLITR